MPRFERLSPEHDLQSFTSGNDDLDSWLRDAAITADRAGTARVYLWIGCDERIALSEEFHGQHIGGDLLAEALTTILNAIRIAGGRVIVVDAIDERARGFYEYFGFRSLPLNDDRLVMKASTAATSLSIDRP